MSLDTLELTAEFPVKPAKIYASWLEGKRHAHMTGSHASGQPVVGAKFKAWDGYITGENVDLSRDKHIVQSWRTTDFTPEQTDSRLEVTLTALPGGGTRLTLVHTDLPKGSKEKYLQGWKEFYFAPMAKFFGA